MAKFKVGDQVKVKNIPEKIGTITAVDSDGDVKIKGVGKDYEAMWVKQEYVSKVANSAPLSTNPVVANALAARNAKFDNPYYKPETGIPFLDRNFVMFDKKIAKEMIADAKSKGVAIPKSLEEKARKAGIWTNSAVATNADWHTDALVENIRDVIRSINKGIGYVDDYGDGGPECKNAKNVLNQMKALYKQIKFKGYNLNY